MAATPQRQTNLNQSNAPHAAALVKSLPRAPKQGETMTPTEKYEAASAELRTHEIAHIKIQRQYEESYAKLETLNRAASEAWREMIRAMERQQS